MNRHTWEFLIDTLLFLMIAISLTIWKFHEPQNIINFISMIVSFGLIGFIIGAKKW